MIDDLLGVNFQEVDIIAKMNDIKHSIDPESKSDYNDIFTKRGTVVSGSEGTVFYVSRTIALSELLQHSYPIVIDSFRAEDLSTAKEDVVLKLLKKLGKQCILTTTLKLEEMGKYSKYTDINILDYTGHEPNKILQSNIAEAFVRIVEDMGVQIDIK